MASIQRLVETEQLRSTRFNQYVNGNTSAFWTHYDDLADDLMLLIVHPSTRTVVHYLDGELALLYEPDSQEIVGFQVENFRASFLQSHREVDAIWRISMPLAQSLDMAFLTRQYNERNRELARKFHSIATAH